MKILGIETSCDETAASVIQGDRKKIKVLSNIISSQINIHKKYGGVVPEVAAREHILNIIPVINKSLIKARIEPKNAHKKISAIAVTCGPGLMSSLIIGVETAKSLGYIWKVPIIATNHIMGHIYANFIDDDIEFPALILTVSGGHTILILMQSHKKYKIIGETCDDAAGEAFDKASKMMNLGYPGGPIISKYADKFKDIKNKKIKFPRPMIDSKNYDFSFSGLKTALLYALKEDKNWQKKIPEYAYEFQQAIIDVLIKKTIKANNKYAVKTIMLAGGVSANKELRKQFKNAIKKIKNVEFKMPDLKYTTDNATMIATAGYFKAQRKEFTLWKKLKADCNCQIGI